MDLDYSKETSSAHGPGTRRLACCDRGLRVLVPTIGWVDNILCKKFENLINSLISPMTLNILVWSLGLLVIYLIFIIPAHKK